MWDLLFEEKTKNIFLKRIRNIDSTVLKIGTEVCEPHNQLGLHLEYIKAHYIHIQVAKYDAPLLKDKHYQSHNFLINWTIW